MPAQQAGSAALAGGRRTRRPGEQKALGVRREAMIRRHMVGRRPDQLNLPFALWTREAVGQLMRRKASLRLSLSAIGSHLWPTAGSLASQAAGHSGLPWRRHTGRLVHAFACFWRVAGRGVGLRLVAARPW